jgi:AcrR family transcriptional regulator
MADTVKASRAYSSPKREAQAAATRAEIAEAAHRLFLAYGYIRTTLADIAAEAGVSVPTVKLAYGTKRQVLLAAWDFAVKGGPDTRPVVEQEWFQEMVATPDPREHLRLLAAGTAIIRPRIMPMTDVIRTAAAADLEIAALLTKMSGEYYENQRTVIRSLRRKGKLRNGLTEKTATDVLYTLNAGVSFQVLVLERGWTVAAYEKWLTRLLIEQLLEPEEAD